MTKPLLLFLILLFSMCSPAKQETTTADSATVEQSHSVVTEQSAPAEEQAPTPTLTSKSFEEIPTDLQAFLTAVQDPTTLALYINSTMGCYIIEEGAGIYPVVTEVKAPEEFNKNAPFTLFMNTPQLYNGFYINNEGVDPCNLPADGIFFFDAKKDRHLVFSAYQSQLSATNETMSDELKTK